MELRLTKSIKPHPLNAALYADAADGELLESIRKIGIQSPLLITQDGLIISGHRRFNAAQALQLESVPVNVSSLTDPLDIEEALIETNRQRQKTTEQMAREFQRLKEIEKEKKEAIRLANLKRGDKLPDVQNFAHRENSKARDNAAEKVGFNSGFQAEKAATVVSAIDKLQQRGEVEQAQALRTTLNEKSVHAAFQAAREIDPPPPPKPAPAALELPANTSTKLAPLLSSETAEHYTPKSIIDAALNCMGEIDTDPCSNSLNRPNVPAKTHYTQAENGLDKDWNGRVFLNPPYGREIKAWVEKLLEEYDAEHITEAIALVPARTDTEWFQLLMDDFLPFCLVDGRLTFVNNTAPAPFPSAIFYIGSEIGNFYRAFSGIGRIVQQLPQDGFGE